MKTKIVVLSVMAAATVGITAHLIFRAEEPSKQEDAAAPTRTTSHTRQAARPTEPIANPAIPQLARGDYAQLSAQMTPEEARVIASAILNCSALYYAAAQQPNQETKSKPQKEIEDNCERMKNEFSVYDLAKYAAQSGDTQAQLEFSALAAGAFEDEKATMNTELMDDYKSSTLIFLEGARKSGKIEALSRLSANYASGQFSDADPVLAYAYASAYARKSGTELSQKRAKQLSAGLSATEVAQADNLARSM